MECFVPGRILLLPSNFDAEEYAGHFSEAAEMSFEFEYSFENILNKYDFDRDRLADVRKRFGPFPMVGRVPEGQEALAVSRLAGHKLLRAVCPDYLVRPTSNISIKADAISDAIQAINADPVGSRCGENCTIGVLDTGVDRSLLPSPNSVESVQYDVTDPTDNGQSPSDHDGHGTLVAYIINAIAPGANIVSIRTMTNTGTISDALAGMYLAKAKGCDLLNMSFSLSCEAQKCRVCGTPGPISTNVQQLSFFFSEFLQGGEDIVILAAAGNGYPHVALPAAFDNVLAVGGFDHANSQPSYLSQYHQVPEKRYVMAPGGEASALVSFASKPANGGPEPLHGTSFATAFATGIAARLVCSLRGGNCSLGQTSSCGLFKFIRDQFESKSDTSWAGFQPQLHGLGALYYY